MNSLSVGEGFLRPHANSPLQSQALTISSTARSVRKHYTHMDTLSLNIDLIRVAAKEKFILSNCLCSGTNTRHCSKHLAEAVLPSHAAPRAAAGMGAPALASCRRGRRLNACLSFRKELVLVAVLSQACGPAFAQNHRRRGCSLSIWK